MNQEQKEDMARDLYSHLRAGIQHRYTYSPLELEKVITEISLLGTWNNLVPELMEGCERMMEWIISQPTHLSIHRLRKVQEDLTKWLSYYDFLNEIDTNQWSQK